MPSFIRIALFFAAVCSFAAHASAQLKWDETTRFVAATPADGKAVAHFTFTNIGDHPVKILDTKTSCGCTAAVPDRRVFAPGEKGEVTVTFKTINRNSVTLYEEPVTVKTDDSATPETVLKLHIRVQDVIEAQPTFLFWRAGAPLAPKSICVNVTQGFDVKQISAAASDANISTRIETVRPGGEYNVIVTPKSQRLKATVSIQSDYQSAAQKEPKPLIAHVRVD